VIALDPGTITKVHGVGFSFQKFGSFQLVLEQSGAGGVSVGGAERVASRERGKAIVGLMSGLGRSAGERVWWWSWARGAGAGEPCVGTGHNGWVVLVGPVQGLG
jgi:hypothetical protein